MTSYKSVQSVHTVRIKDGRIVEDRALGIYPNSVYQKPIKLGIQF